MRDALDPTVGGLDTAPVTAAAGATWTRSSVASAVTALSLAATAVGLVFACTRPTVENLVQGHLIGDAAAAVVAALVGGLLLIRIPRQPVGLLLSAVGLADGIALLASGLQSARPGDPGALWAAEWTWLPGTALLLLLPVVVPDGPRARPERLLLGAGIAAAALATFGASTQRRLASGPTSSVPNPLALPGGDALQVTGLLALGAVTILGLVVLGRRILRSDQTERRRLLPFLAAGAVAITTVSVAPSLGLAGAVLQDLGLLLVPLSCLLSVLRLRLYSIEIAIGRSVVWIGVTAVLVGGYVAVVQLGGRLLRLPEAPSSVVATALVALAFAPLRAWLQRAVVRWLYGGRADPSGTLAAVTRLLADPDAEEALDRAVRAIADALRVPGARVLRGGAVIAGATEGAAALAIPLRVGDAPVGALEVLPRSVGERFSRADERLLADLAPAVAAGLAAVVARKDLERARSALALDREAERRRVRAQLHDDIGPALAAAALQARTALRRLARADASAAQEAVEEVAVTVGRAAQDLRSAVDALGPRALDELGLEAAVAALASSVSSEALGVVTRIGALPELSPAVESAVYRITAESLTNVVRHAGARRASITVSTDARDLTLTVSDDGNGTRIDRPGGLGVDSMRARATELGGVLTITQGPGTTVVARLPLEVDR